MEDRISEWIEGEDSPRDFYELLGVRQFDPHREKLLKAIKAATRVVQLYQNHQEKKIVRRAHEYQGMLGKAAETFSDDDLWSDYDEALVEQLHRHYATGAGSNSAGWRPEYLRRWLTAVRDVHPERIDELIGKLIPSAGATAPKREVELIEPEEPPAPQKPKAAAEQPKVPLRQPAPPELEDPPPASPDRPPKKPPPLKRPVPAAGESPFRAPNPARPTKESDPALPRRKPPTRPGVRQAPLAKVNQPGPGPARGAVREKGPADTSLLWLIGSAVATTMFLAVICAAIVIVVMRKRSSEEPPPPTPPAGEAEEPSADDLLLEPALPEFDPATLLEDDPF